MHNAATETIVVEPPVFGRLYGMQPVDRASVSLGWCQCGTRANNVVENSSPELGVRCAVSYATFGPTK